MVAILGNLRVYNCQDNHELARHEQQECVTGMVLGFVSSSLMAAAALLKFRWRVHKYEKDPAYHLLVAGR